MTLRRTPLSRKAPLKARTGLARRTPLPRARAKRLSNAQAPTRRPRSTGPTQRVRDTVRARADGCCEIPGCGLLIHDGYAWLRPHSFHHRRPRQMGGDPRPTTNSPANLLLVCGTGTTGCHGALEQARADAYERGWLVHRDIDDPSTVPVELHAYPNELTLLTHEGGTRRAP